MVLSWTSRFLLSNFHFLILKSRNHHKHLRLGDDGTQKHLEAPWGGSHWYFAQLCAEAVINICQTERDEITRQQDLTCVFSSQSLVLRHIMFLPVIHSQFHVQGKETPSLGSPSLHGERPQKCLLIICSVSQGRVQRC